MPQRIRHHSQGRAIAVLLGLWFACLAGDWLTPAWAQSAPNQSKLSLPSALQPQTAEPAQPAPPSITLNHRIIVRGSAVKLGEIFAGPLPDPDRAIAYAPAAGEKIRLNASWLAEVARNNNVAWQPSDASEQAVVERARVVLNGRDILQAVAESLVAQGLSADSDLGANPGAMAEIAAPISSQPVVRVDDATFSGGAFTAAVTILSVNYPDQHMTISGKIYPTLAVPTLSRPVAQRDLIGADDFVLVRKRAVDVQAGVVVEPQRLIGMTATRPLRAGETIQAGDIARPILVPRGETVTLILQTPYMTLTASGKALENGSLGDTIRIENTRSNKILFGIVTESRTVVVRSDGAALN